MSGLAEHLTAKIHPEVSSLWAVADGDGLFRNDEIARVLTARGVEILLYEDPIAFRFRYEHEVRPRLALADPGCFVVVVEPGHEGLRCLPADLYEASRHLEVTLGDLFPSLARKVLRELEPSVLSDLWRRRDLFPAGLLGERDTADLVLRMAYRVEPSALGSLQDLIRWLLEIHYQGLRLPGRLAQRVEQIAAPNMEQVRTHPDLISNPGVFWQFLQTELDRWNAKGGAVQGVSSAPDGVSFNDRRLLVWLDNLLQEGILRAPPVAADAIITAGRVVGAVRGDVETAAALLATERQQLLEKRPGPEAGYKDWLHFAHRYSAHVASAFARDLEASQTAAFWRELWAPVNEGFTAFVAANLESLSTLPPTRPVLVNHIARFLSRRAGEGVKVALLVMDGLSLAQWFVLRRELSQHMPELCSSEDACFTLIPSLTNVARQAIYSGEIPFFFGGTIERTDMDGRRWKTCWDGVPGRPVRSLHLNLAGEEADFRALCDGVETGAGAVGITVRMPDEIVHGATLGWRGVSEQLRLWARQSFLRESISAILNAGYELYLTSDHGNLEALGAGGYSQGVLAERSGERVRIYGDAAIFAKTAAMLSGRAQDGSNKLLPQTYLPLIHKGRGAYVTAGQTVVSHGGSSLDEMVVPFVQLSRMSQS